MEERRSFGGGGGRNRDDRKSFGNKEGAPRRMIRIQRIAIPKGTEIDYKNIAFLQKCLTERGKVFSRRMTSATAAQQRQLTMAVKRARFLGLLPSGAARKK